MPALFGPSRPRILSLPSGSLISLQRTKTMTILTDFNLVVASVAVAFVLGVLFSTKIKDWVKGIPSDVRAGLTQVETAVQAKLKAAHAAAVAPAIAAVAVPPAAPAAAVAAPTVAAPPAPVAAPVVAPVVAPTVAEAVGLAAVSA